MASQPPRKHVSSSSRRSLAWLSIAQIKSTSQLSWNGQSALCNLFHFLCFFSLSLEPSVCLFPFLLFLQLPVTLLFCCNKFQQRFRPLLLPKNNLKSYQDRQPPHYRRVDTRSNFLRVWHLASPLSHGSPWYSTKIETYTCLKMFHTTECPFSVGGGGRRLPLSRYSHHPTLFALLEFKFYPIMNTHIA